MNTIKLKRSAYLFKYLISFFILICLLFFISSCDQNNNNSLDPEISQQLIEILTENLNEFEIPGAIVGVWIPGEGNLIIEEGVSDLVDNNPIKKTDHTRIGSITKSYTVTVVLQLVDEGIISLDDPLSRFFPEIENSEATVRDLANMRSGIFNYTEDNNFVLELIEDLLRKWTPQELVDVGDRNNPYFQPDQGWHYSNTSTVILGMIIEQVTGQPLGKVIQDRIIVPLGLSGTIYPVTPNLPDPFTRGYLELPSGFTDVTLSDPSSSAGSGAMVSKLQDLRKWAEALGTGSLISEELQQERLDSLQEIVFDPCQDNDPEREKRSCPEYDKYGIGIGEISGWIGHTGEAIGYTLLAMYNPANGSIVVIIMNRSGVGAHVPTKVFIEYAKILN